MNRMMRIIASFIAVSFSNASAVEFPDVGSFNPTWKSAQPGSSYDRSLPSAALLGNGSLGVVNGGDANHKKFVLTRGDLRPHFVRHRRNRARHGIGQVHRHARS